MSTTSTATPVRDVTRAQAVTHVLNLIGIALWSVLFATFVVGVVAIAVSADVLKMLGVMAFVNTAVVALVVSLGARLRP